MKSQFYGQSGEQGNYDEKWFKITITETKQSNGIPNLMA